jgi:hypothetical protein
MEYAMANLNQQDPRQRPSVPKEFGGKWIAWNSNATRIIASGETLEDCAAAAAQSGEANPQFEKVPRPDVRIIGMAR